jgi:hypothetical protein
LLKLAQMEINEMTNSFATFNGVEVLKGFDLNRRPSARGVAHAAAPGYCALPHG